MVKIKITQMLNEKSFFFQQNAVISPGNGRGTSAAIDRDYYSYYGQ